MINKHYFFLSFFFLINNFSLSFFFILFTSHFSSFFLLFYCLSPSPWLSFSHLLFLFFPLFYFVLDISLFFLLCSFFLLSIFLFFTSICFLYLYTFFFSIPFILDIFSFIPVLELLCFQYMFFGLYSILLLPTSTKFKCQVLQDPWLKWKNN